MSDKIRAKVVRGKYYTPGPGGLQVHSEGDIVLVTETQMKAFADCLRRMPEEPKSVEPAGSEEPKKAAPAAPEAPTTPGPAAPKSKG